MIIVYISFKHIKNFSFESLVRVKKKPVNRVSPAKFISFRDVANAFH